MKQFKFTILAALAANLISNIAVAAPPNDAGGEWICEAGGSRLIAYSYPYDGSDYDRVLIHLEPYPRPTEKGYYVKKESEIRVTGYTGDGTPFSCELPQKKKKKK